MINSNFDFELNEHVKESSDKVLIYAPLKLELACRNKSVERAICKEDEIGKSGRPRTRIRRLLSKSKDDYNQVFEQIMAGNDPEAKLITNYEKWWIGLFDASRAKEIVNDINMFTDRYHMACGYGIHEIKKGYVYLGIWHDI
jgi:hypothetical protein